MTQVVLANDKRFEATAPTTILDAARAAGIVLEHSCRTGRCGTCKARVVRGRTESVGDDSGLSDADRQTGHILTCTSAAIDEVHLDIDDVSLLADFPSRTTPCRIDALDRPAVDVLRVLLRFPPKAAPRYLPGQYVDVIGPGGVRRSYSVANAPSADGRLELHIRAVPGGALSAYWFGAAKAGDLLRLEGPKGSFFLRDVAGLDLVFLATGTGIAPVKAMLEGMADRVTPGLPRSVTVLWGGRHAVDLYWQVAAGGVESLEYVPVLSRAGDDWQGARGHVQQALLDRQPDWSRTMVYACGSAAMIASASEQLVAAGLPPRRFLSDAFVSSSI
ncbi:2Fe-2S iron-sulfur cluster binding domain-containing protein [Xylophilus rhododendri]|uniref:2Fe-2S iron-sulfur cluster binding domain-containing protein n=1 Tax=Xylophilus rhododendri TaxID=2697032 RepID=A0A857JAZ3_9BURK|nr:2Fe-2S iron-sulfur cluster-binding protein [Xylophilus rhododendri]QHJ00153.1 2Fe-2S iron-sulfur cluster binding domain-containing protein [Xylophilus rhododendri]